MAATADTAHILLSMPYREAVALSELIDDLVEDNLTDIEAAAWERLRDEIRKVERVIE